jgi:heme-degrading monooxygenase HmoA
MIVTIFRSRLRPEHAPEYHEAVKHMVEIATKMPGYLSHKVFSHEDGERVNIVEFSDEASQRAWATETRHLEAKKRGRAAFYAEYRLQVCSVLRESTFSATESAGTPHPGPAE